MIDEKVMFLGEECVSPGLLCKLLGIPIELIVECQELCYLYKEFNLIEDIVTQNTLCFYLKAKAIKKQCFLNYKSWFKEDGGIDIKLSYYITKYYAKLVYNTERKRYPTAELFFRENSYSITTHVNKIKESINNEIVNYLCTLDKESFDKVVEKSNKKRII